MRIGDLHYTDRSRIGTMFQNQFHNYLKSRYPKVEKPNDDIFRFKDYILNHTPDHHVVGKAILDSKISKNIRIDLPQAYTDWQSKYGGNFGEIPIYFACQWVSIGAVALYDLNAIYTADKSKWFHGEWEDGEKFFRIPDNFPIISLIHLEEVWNPKK